MIPAAQPLRPLLLILAFCAALMWPGASAWAACLQATGEVSCGPYPGQYWVKLGAAGAFDPGEISISSATPGVAILTPKVLTGGAGATFVLVSGAAPGGSVTLVLDSAADAAGGAPGAAICCGGEVTVSIPPEILCEEPYLLDTALSCEACAADGDNFLCLCKATLRTKGKPKSGALSIAASLKAKNGLLVAASGPDWDCGALPVGPGSPLVCKLKTRSFEQQNYASAIDLAIKFKREDELKSAASCLTSRASDGGGKLSAASSASCVALNFPKIQPLIAPQCDARTARLKGDSCACRFEGMVPVSATACGCKAGFRFEAGEGCVEQAVHRRDVSTAHKKMRSDQHEARTTRQRGPAHKRAKSLLDEAHKEFTSAEHQRATTKRVPQHRRAKSDLDAAHKKFSSEEHDGRTTRRVEVHKKFQSALDEFHREFKSEEHDRKTTRRVERHRRAQSALDEFHREFKSEEHDRKTTRRIERHRRAQSALDEFHREFKSEEHDRKTTGRIERHRRAQSALDEFHREFKSEEHDRKTTGRIERHRRAQSALDEFHREFKSEEHDRKTTGRRETHRRAQSALDEFHREFKSEEHDRKTTRRRETHRKAQSALDGIHKIMTSKQHNRATSLPIPSHSRKRSNAEEHGKDRSDADNVPEHSRKRSAAEQHAKAKSAADTAPVHTRRKSLAEQHSKDKSAAKDDQPQTGEEKPRHSVRRSRLIVKPPEEAPPPDVQ